ncbi:MAG: response regulator [Actinomycetota bacterium]
MSKRVLVVDDEADTRLLLRYILEQRGLDIAEAESGEEALSSLEESVPDAMVLDIRLPGMNGWEVLEQVRSDRRFERMKVVIMSAHVAPSAEAEALARGGNAFVPKPFRWERFDETLDTLNLISARAPSQRRSLRASWSSAFA